MTRDRWKTIFSWVIGKKVRTKLSERELKIARRISLFLRVCITAIFNTVAFVVALSLGATMKECWIGLGVLIFLEYLLATA